MYILGTVVAAVLIAAGPLLSLDNNGRPMIYTLIVRLAISRSSGPALVKRTFNCFLTTFLTSNVPRSVHAAR
jgi:hypothetical protein